MGTVNVWEKDMKRNTNFCLIQGHRVASCKALYLPLGSVFLLDILSLMNCHSSHLRSHRGSRPLPGHTHTVLSGQSACYSCPASFALRKPQLPQELLRRNFCLCPSFPNLWPHTLVHLWQATAASWPRASLPHPPSSPPPPPIFCIALRHLCALRRMSRKAGGTSESTAGTEQGCPHSRVT